MRCPLRLAENIAVCELKRRDNKRDKTTFSEIVCAEIYVHISYRRVSFTTFSFSQPFLSNEASGVKFPTGALIPDTRSKRDLVFARELNFGFFSIGANLAASISEPSARHIPNSQQRVVRSARFCELCR